MVLSSGLILAVVTPFIGDSRAGVRKVDDAADLGFKALADLIEKVGQRTVVGGFLYGLPR